MTCLKSHFEEISVQCSNLLIIRTSSISIPLGSPEWNIMPHTNIDVYILFKVLSNGRNVSIQIPV